MKRFGLPFLLIAGLLVAASDAQAWHDKTHITVSRVAGLASWYNSAGPDLAKIKAGHVESYNHYFNNNAEDEITVSMVFHQIDRYNERNKLLDSEGHLLGAIIAALRAYDKDIKRGKYAEYHLNYCAHYIADLSQPLHLIAYDDFNKTFHDLCDGVVETTIVDQPHKIADRMYAITLRPDFFEEDLAREIARIANLTCKLGYKLRAENRALTREEAYIQLAHSASLLKAVLSVLEQKQRTEKNPPAFSDGRQTVSPSSR